MLTGRQKIVTCKILHQFILDNSLKHFAYHWGKAYWSVIVTQVSVTFFVYSCNCGFFHSVSNTPSLRDLLKIKCRGCTDPSFVSKRTLGWQLSGPLGLWDFKLLNCFQTSSAVTETEVREPLRPGTSNEGTSPGFSCVKTLPKNYSEYWPYQSHQQSESHQALTVHSMHV